VINQLKGEANTMKMQEFSDRDELRKLYPHISDVFSYCKHCGKPEQYVDINQNVTQDDSHSKCRRIAKFKKLSIISKFSEGAGFEKANIINDKEKIFFESYKKYVENFDKCKDKGIGILMLGNAGTGKTFAADCIANELIKNGYAVLSFTLSGYMNEIKKGFDSSSPANNVEDELLSATSQADLIIIDDVGSEKITEWTSERVFNLFNTIYMNKKSVIVTSNLSGKELSEHLTINGSNKISDRISEMCKMFVYDWTSRRADIGKEKFKDIFG